jgi:hypothetical protein
VSADNPFNGLPRVTGLQPPTRPRPPDPSARPVPVARPEGVPLARPTATKRGTAAAWVQKLAASRRALEAVPISAATDPRLVEARRLILAACRMREAALTKLIGADVRPGGFVQ